MQLIIAAEGQSLGDCALNSSTAALTGLALGASTMTVLLSGTTTVNVVTCPTCIFGPKSSFSALLPYSCQNIILGVATTDVHGAVLLQAVAQPPTEGSLLSSLAWQVTPLLQVLDDSVTGITCRGTQSFAGAVSATFMPITVGSSVTPNSAAINVEVSLVASQLYASISITEKQTMLQVSVMPGPVVFIVTRFLFVHWSFVLPISFS